MLRVLVLLLVCSLSTQASPAFNIQVKFLEPLETPYELTPEDALEIAQGILEGLQENSNAPGQCYTDMSSTVTNVQKIYADVKAIVGGNTSAWTPFATDVQAFLDQMKSFNPDCNFTGLIATIESFMTPTGVVVLLKNFFEHMATILADAKDLKNCSSNFKGCGVDIGSIIRLLVGWNLNAELQASYQGNFQDFMMGLLNGLSDGQNNECTADVSGVTTQVDTLIADFQKLFRGDILVISQIYNLAKEIVASLDSFAPDCNIPALEAALAKLATVDGWILVLKNYIANEATISSSLKGIENCSSNYTGCGTDLGTVISVLLGWTL